VVQQSVATESCGTLAQSDWASGFSPAANLCPCNCTVTQPHCADTVDFKVADGDQCSVTDVFYAGKCEPKQGTLLSHYELSPLAPVGGGCGTPSTMPDVSMGKLGTRTCAMPQGCPGAPCAGPNQKACIMRSGIVPCPQDYPVGYAVGSDVSVNCMCGVSCSFGAVCSNPALHFYVDGMCAMEIMQIPASGMCTASSAGGKIAGSYQYIATPNGTCTPATGKAVTDLTNKSTLCCKP
jgi:hypothetical protein